MIWNFGEFSMNLDISSFFYGLSLGSIFGYLIKHYFTKIINRKFDRENKQYDQLHERYSKLYSPLRFQIIGVTFETSGKLTLYRKIPYIFKGILKRDFVYVWNFLNYNPKYDPNGYYLAGYSRLNLEGISTHVKKYSRLADNKLIELLDEAIRERNENDYYREGEYALPKAYYLVKHIYKYSENLNKKLHLK